MFTNNKKLIIACIMLMGPLITVAAVADTCGDLLTNDNDNQSGGNRHSFTAQGDALWFDINGVYYFDGANSNGIWTVDPNLTGHENVEDFVFGLGGGAHNGEVIGLWRAGTDFAWIWSNNGDEPNLVAATNPIDANEPMNPEGVAIADGCVFVVLQAFSGGEAVKHVFQVDPDSAEAINLTGDAAVPGVDGRVRTGGCMAAWPFDDGTGQVKLHLFDGDSVTTVDTNGYPSALVDGVLVYTKFFGAVEHVFVYDSNEASPKPVQISPDDGGSNESPKTDGRHVAWIHVDPDTSERHIMLLGGLSLSDEDSRAADQPRNREAPLQLDRGQLLWEDFDGALRYHHDGRTDVVCDRGDTDYEGTWLTDGVIVTTATTTDTGADTEVFRYVGKTPNDSDQPAAPILVRATPGDGEVELAWDTVLGATGYRIYVSTESGVSASNYLTQPGGRVLIADKSPFVVDCLTDEKYYIVVSTVEGAHEGPESAEISVKPSKGAPDADDDGAPDCLDECPNDPNKKAMGLCGCEITDNDMDTDGVVDCLDGCPNDAGKTEPGDCGCGQIDSDADGDGAADCVDVCPEDAMNACASDNDVIDDVSEGDDLGDDMNADDKNDSNSNGAANIANGENEENAQSQSPDGLADCGAGMCGAGASAMLPLMISTLWSGRRRHRRHGDRGAPIRCSTGRRFIAPLICICSVLQFGCNATAPNGDTGGPANGNGNATDDAGNDNGMGDNTANSGDWNDQDGLSLVDGNVTLDVPPTAAPTNKTLTVRALAADELLPDSVPPGSGFDAGGEFGPDGTVFDGPVEVTVTLESPAAMDTLPVLLQDEATGDWGWAGVDAKVASDGITATFEVTHFSRYRVWNPPLPRGDVPIGEGEIIAGPGNFQGQPFNTLPNPMGTNASLAYSPFGDVFGLSVMQFDVTNPATGDNISVAVGLHASRVGDVEGARVGLVTPAGALSGPSVFVDGLSPPKGISGIMFLRKDATHWKVDVYCAYEGGIVFGQATGEL